MSEIQFLESWLDCFLTTWVAVPLPPYEIQLLHNNSNDIIVPETGSD
jgi:hypothetical protein